MDCNSKLSNVSSKHKTIRHIVSNCHLLNSDKARWWIYFAWYIGCLCNSFRNPLTLFS